MFLSNYRERGRLRRRRFVIDINTVASEEIQIPIESAQQERLNHSEKNFAFRSGITCKNAMRYKTFLTSFCETVINCAFYRA